MKNTYTEDKLTATRARDYAKRINAETCLTDAKARKWWGGWEINIGGGRSNCYGRTVETVEGAEDLIRIFAND